MIVLILLASAALEQYNRANTLFQQQKFVEAEEALNSALRADPKLVPALTLKGKLAMALNRFDVARVCFEKAADLEPKSPYVQFLLGFFHYVDNDFKKALPALEQARKLEPDNPRTHFYLALSHEGLALPEKAAELYRKTVELETSQGKPSADTHIAYGRLLFTQGDYQASEVQIRRAMELDPKSRDGHYESGRLHFERGEWEKAAVEGEKASKLPGVGVTDRQIHFLLARAYGKLGKKELAEAHLAKFKASGVSLRR
jgi:tetratricopeptide (TPR) repeat protein